MASETATVTQSSEIKKELGKAKEASAHDARPDELRATQGTTDVEELADLNTTFDSSIPPSVTDESDATKHSKDESPQNEDSSGINTRRKPHLVALLVVFPLLLIALAIVMVPTIVFLGKGKESSPLATLFPIPSPESTPPTSTNSLTNAPASEVKTIPAPAEQPIATGPGITIAFSSPLPTFQPARPPTFQPARPPTTSTPTEAPTAAPVDVTMTPLFLRMVSLGTSPEVLTDESTPQGQALTWLLQPDISPIEDSRIVQRFVLVAMDFAFGGNWKRNDTDFCTWNGVTCSNDGRNDTEAIKWPKQGLTGTIIPEVGLLSHLKRLDLAENQLSGSLDPLWKLSNLTHMYLFQNNFSGKIPKDASSLRNLEHLYLGHNHLTGGLPLSLVSSTLGPRNLRYLILNHNKLSGNITSGMQTRKLFYLDLGNNDFSGPLPSDWDFPMVRLRTLYLDNNKLTGTVPDYFPTLGGGRVNQLYLNDNLLTGTLPKKNWPVGLITNMNIGNNLFTGKIDKNICMLSVFKDGEMVELVADCGICTCDDLCHTCTNGDNA